MPFVTVHVNLLLPDTNPLTEVLAEAGTDSLAVPVLDQLPLPIVGTVACSVPLPLQLVLAKPAFALTLLLLT